MPKISPFSHADVHMFDRFDGSSAFMKGHGHVVEFNNAHGSFLASFEHLFKFIQYVLFDESRYKARMSFQSIRALYYRTL